MMFSEYFRPIRVADGRSPLKGVRRKCPTNYALLQEVQNPFSSYRRSPKRKCPTKCPTFLKLLRNMTFIMLFPSIHMLTNDGERSRLLWGIPFVCLQFVSSHFFVNQIHEENVFSKLFNSLDRPSVDP